MEEKQEYAIVARPKNYWMSPRAVSITLNALNEANRIQASTAAGARIFCHFKEYKKIGNREIFGYDAGHGFHSWSLVIYPTYFETNEAVYVHVAIPRAESVGAQAMFVFPTVILDVEGYEVEEVKMQNDDGDYIDEQGNVVDKNHAAIAYVRKKNGSADADPVGSADYYYIYLHGMLTSSWGGVTFREWDPMYDTGMLDTAETWDEVITLEQLAKEMKKKVDVDWFMRLFTAHGTNRMRVPVPGEVDEDGNPIAWETDPETGEYVYDGDDDERIVKPNDMEHEITDLQSIFGLWTEQFLSALGKGDGSGGSPFDLHEPLLSINEAELGLPPSGSTGKVGIVYNYSTGRYEWGETGGGVNGLILKDGTDVISPESSGDQKTYVLSRYFLSLKHGGTMEPGANLLINRVEGFDVEGAADNLVLTKGETKTLFDGKYVTVEFFDSLFELHDGNLSGNGKIDVNGTIPLDKSKLNIKSMFGFWTEQYISALGQGSSGGSGSVELGNLLNTLNTTQGIQGLPQNGQTLVYNSGWTFGTAGMDETQLGSYLSRNKYIKADNNTKWWGRTMTNNVVKGNIDMVHGDSIGWIENGGFLSMMSLKTENSNNLFILGEGTYLNGIPTYLRGSSIYFQTASGDVDAKLTSDDSVFWVKKLKIGNILIVEDTQKGGIRIVDAGFYADKWVSALGSGSSSNPFDLSPLLNSLNTYGPNPSAAGTGDKVLVYSNGSWRWDEYGAGGSGGGGSTDIPVSWWGAPVTTVDGSKVVKGNMINVGNITFEESGKNIGGMLYFNTASSQLKVASNANEVTFKDDNASFTPKFFVDGIIATNSRMFAQDIDLYGENNGDNSHGGYIDFHFANKRTVDYTSRIIEDVSGVLKINNTLWAKLSGNVGIGTSSPTAKLDVRGNALVDGQLNIGSNNTFFERIGWVNNSYTDSKDVFYIYSWNPSAGTSGQYRDMLFGTYVDAIQYGGLYFDGSSWSWGIGTKTPQYKLDVNGSLRATRFYLHKSDGTTGDKDVYLEYSATYKGVHVVGGGLYADEWISALGQGTSSTPFDLSPLLNSLNGSNLVPSGQQTNKVLVNNGGNWSWQDYNAGGSGVSDDYLPLIIPGSGKTVSMPSIGALTFKSSASDYPLIRFEGKTSGGLGFIGIGKTGNTINPYYVTAVDGVYKDAKDYPDNHSEWYILVHSGNVGAYAVTSIGTDGDDLTWTKNGTANSLTVPYATYTRRLGQTTLDGTASLSSFKHSTDLIYTAKGGGNTVKDKPSGVTAFGVISMKVADGYYGQLLYSSTGSLHCRASNSLEGVAWKTIAFTDGTIAKADRLSGTGSYTAWGRTYWSSGQPTSISGNLENVDEIIMNNNHFIRIKDNPDSGGTVTNVNMIGMDGSNNLSLFWGALAKGYNSGIYGYNVYIGHGQNGSNPAYYTCCRENGHVTINANDKTGYFLTVGGDSFANTVVGKQLKTKEGTAGETVVLNTSATYDCIVYQINGSSKWSVGADSNNNFYWYSQPGNQKTVMSLSSAGRLKVEELQIGDITISVEKQNNTSIGLRVSKGLAATTYISALGTGSSESGGGADLTTVWQSLSSNQAPYQNTQIDINHFNTTLDSYLSGKSYATLTDINPYVKTISWSTDIGHTDQLKYTKGNNSSTYVTIGYATKAGSTESASRLSGTADKTAWGQTYWSNGVPETISNAPLTGVTNISMSGYVTGCTEIRTRNGARIYNLTAQNEYTHLYIGREDNAGWVYLADCCGQPTKGTEGNWALFSSGEARFKNVGINGVDSSYKLYVAGNIKATEEVYAKGLELYNSGDPHIDFHNSDSTADYTTRIIEKKVTGSSPTHYCLAVTPYTNTKVGLSVGDGKTGSYIRIGGATLTWDGSALKIDTGFYSESFISALGTGSSGGGTTDITLGLSFSNPTLTVNVSGVSKSVTLSGFVTTSGSQEISGAKTFTSDMIVKSSGKAAIGQANVDSKYRLKVVYNGVTSDNVTKPYCIYATGPSRFDNIYINEEAAQNYRLYVNGTSCLNGNVGIGGYNASYNLYVNGTSYFNGNVTVNGTLTFSRDEIGQTASGKTYEVRMISSEQLYIESLGRPRTKYDWYTTSDERDKTIISNLDASIEQIARAPIFNYKLIDDESNIVSIGSSAQYWYRVFPNAVSIGYDGKCSMGYASTALAAAVITARKVLTHEERIAALERTVDEQARKIGELEQEVELLKAA